MKKLSIKEDKNGLYLEGSDRFEPTYSDISNLLFNDVKLEDIVDRKKLIARMCKELDNFKFTEENRKYYESGDYVNERLLEWLTWDDFAFMMYTMKVDEEIKRILSSKDIKFEDSESQIQMTGLNIDDSMLNEARKVIDDDCFLDDDEINKNLSLDDAFKCVNELSAEMKKELDKYNEMKDDEDFDYDNYDREREETMEDLCYDIEEHYVNDVNTIIKNIKHYIGIDVHSYALPEYEQDNLSVLPIDQIKKINIQLDKIIMHVLKLLYEKYNFNTDEIHKEAVNRIMHSNLRFDPDVQLAINDNVDFDELERRLDEEEEQYYELLELRNEESEKIVDSYRAKADKHKVYVDEEEEQLALYYDEDFQKEFINSFFKNKKRLQRRIK